MLANTHAVRGGDSADEEVSRAGNEATSRTSEAGRLGSLKPEHREARHCSCSSLLEPRPQ